MSLFDPFSSYLSNEDVQKISSPLSEEFKLSFFDFGRMYNDGSCLIFSTNNKVIDFLFEKKYPLFAPIPSQLIQKKFFYFLNSKDSYQEVTREVKINFNVGDAIDLFDCQDDYVDICCFAAHSEEENTINTYLNNLKKLNGFMDYFRKQTHQILNQLSHKAIMLPEEMRLNFTSQVIDDHRLSYCSENGQRITFTKQESEIIRLLGVGKSNKKIANELNLSPRTIESYLENIKAKAFCNSKSELVEKILEMF